MRLCIALVFISSSVHLGAQGVTDTSTAGHKDKKLKSRLKNIYKKLDSSKSTHKYIQGLNNISNNVSTKYKQLDSLARTDPGTVGKIYNTVAPAKKMSGADSAKTGTTPPDETAGTTNDQSKTNTGAFIGPSPEMTQEQINNEKSANGLVTLGTHYLQLNKGSEAARYYEQGLHAAREAHAPLIAENALKGLYDAYSQKKDITKALSYFRQYIAIKDSLLQVKTDRDMAALRTQYELAKKQGQIQSLQVEGEKKGAELNKSLAYIQEQRQLIVFIAISLALSVILGITIFRQYRSKKKNNELLLIQNNKIEEQKESLEESLAYTRKLQDALKEDLDRYMQMALRKQMNPHFIFNSLNSIQSFILQNDKLSANIYLSKFAGLMRKVLENSQHEFITVSKELEVLKLYVELEEQRFDNTFTCMWDVSEHDGVTENLIPPLILQPYVENAIWHGLLHKDGERTLSINVYKLEDELICCVEDNGIGREAAMKMKKQHAGSGLICT